MRDDSSWRDRIAPALQVLGLVGFVVYALLLWGYDNFYSGLGLRPEDVGVDKTAIVSRTLGLWPIVGLPAVALVLLWRPLTQRFDKTLVRIVYSAVALAAIVVAVFFMGGWLDGKRTHLEEGHRITSLRVLHLTVVDVRAEPAAVQWLGPARDRPVWVSADVTYLGTSNGVDVLYAVGYGVVRVPEADAVVTLVCIRGAGDKYPFVASSNATGNRCAFLR